MSAFLFGSYTDDVPPPRLLCWPQTSKKVDD